MAGCYAVRITLPCEQVQVIGEAWAAYCDQVIAYEHQGTRVHCHLFLLNCNVTTARLKQLANRQERGNTFWNFKTLPLLKADWDKYITYMSKGVYDPFMLYAGADIIYKEGDIQILKEQWVAPTVPAPKLTMLQRYMEFEKLVKLMPFDQRDDETWIRLHARAYLFPQYQMVTQQYKNDLSNFVETYKIKYFR